MSLTAAGSFHTASCGSIALHLTRCRLLTGCRLAVHRSDEQVAQLLHVEPPIDAVLRSLLSSPSDASASPSARRPNHSALHSYLHQAMIRPALRSEDGFNSADLLVSIRQMQPAAVSDMLAGYRA